MKNRSITTEMCIKTMVEGLAEHIGPDKGLNYKSAAEAIGCEYTTMAGYSLGDNLPNFRGFISLCELLGPQFVNHVFRNLAGMDGMHRLEGEGSDNVFTLNAETSDLLREISDALRDGQIDHQEQAKILKEAKELHAVLGDYIAAHTPKKTRAR